MSTGVIIAGVGVAAAGAAVAVIPKGDDANGASATNPGANGPAPVARYDVTFQQGLDISACGATGKLTGLADIQPNASGAFNEVHTQTTPVLRLTGQITATSFQATLACVNGSQSGSMSATGSNNAYSGTYVFSGQTGGFTVSRR